MSRLRPPLVFIGALHVDELIWPTDSMNLHASNPVRRERRVGGVAANAARAAGEWSERQVHLIAATGDDADASWLAQTQRDAGVECHTQRLCNATSGRYTAIHDEHGELLLGLAETAVAERLDTADACHTLSGLQPVATVLDANLSSDSLEWLLMPDKPLGKSVALAVSPAKAHRFARRLERIDLLFCNRREAAALCDCEPTAGIDSLADGLLSAGARRFVLSDGARPIVVQTPAARVRISVPSLAIGTSVNGAGDTMAGASLALWLEHEDLAASVSNAGLPAAHAIISR
mgnify:CR=1 FL=1